MKKVLIINGKKKCSKCKEDKDVKEFYKSSRNKSGLNSRCVSCINPETIRNYYKNVSKLPNKLGITKIRLRAIKFRYNLSEEGYTKLLKSQDMKCAICRNSLDLTNTNQKKIHIDHDHKTGKVRGVLCKDCNHGLGWFKDKVRYLKSAIDYLIINS